MHIEASWRVGILERQFNSEPVQEHESRKHERRKMETRIFFRVFVFRAFVIEITHGVDRPRLLHELAAPWQAAVGFVDEQERERRSCPQVNLQHFIVDRYNTC